MSWPVAPAIIASDDHIMLVQPWAAYVQGAANPASRSMMILRTRTFRSWNFHSSVPYPCKEGIEIMKMLRNATIISLTLFAISAQPSLAQVNMQYDGQYSGQYRG